MASEEIKMKIKKALRAVGEFCFPSDVTCDSCSNELIAKTRYNLCAACSEIMPFVGEKHCLVCGTELHDEADYCIRCQNTESLFKINRSPLIYEGLAAKMVLDLKFYGKKFLAKTLAKMMCDCFISNNMQADILLAVPMTKKELKARGFNQSVLLMNEIAERLKIESSGALLKTRETKTQKNLTAKERAENLDGAFLALPSVKDKNVLLIDDVFTTGSTANACAKALLKARAKSVEVLTAAVTRQRIIME